MPKTHAAPAASDLARQLSAPQLKYDLMAEVRRLRDSEHYRRTGHSAKALAKHPDLRMSITLLEAGKKIRAHKAEARISILALLGRLVLHLPDQTVDLPAGEVFVLEKGVPHDVEALPESAFLLTISWPQD